MVESQLTQLITEALLRLGSDTVTDVIVAPGTDASWEPGATGRWQDLGSFVGGAATSEPACLVGDRDPISYLYTSGTTSAPKGVVSSHVAVYIESLNAPLVLGINGDERSVAMMPLFHTAQLNGFTTGLLYMGGTLVLMRAFDPAVLLATIETERITQIFGLPMMYRAMMDHPDIDTRDLSTLRLALYAMAPMPDADLRRAIEVFGCDFALGFGQTEMNPITTVFPPEYQLSHAGSVGLPVPNVQIGIMDDAGHLLAPGETGEIVYRGPHAMEGYLRNPEATAEAFAHGWLHSGDVGHFDADGLLWFADRKKDVIKSGGENIASIEVEKALYEVEAANPGGRRGGAPPRAVVGGNRGHRDAEGRRRAHREGLNRRRPHPPVGLQGAQSRAVHRRHAAHGNRQDPEERASRAAQPPLRQLTRRSATRRLVIVTPCR